MKFVRFEQGGHSIEFAVLRDGETTEVQIQVVGPDDEGDARTATVWLTAALAREAGLAVLDMADAADGAPTTTPCPLCRREGCDGSLTRCTERLR